MPAEAATIARTDAIHTRMHSKESAAVNQSAFMLDLSQMAHIFRHSTSRSLCLIDEFGKGTNAQDGISLLYASLAELLNRASGCPRVLTCTHYTELLEVPGFREQPGLVLWTMQVLLKDRAPAQQQVDEIMGEIMGEAEGEAEGGPMDDDGEEGDLHPPPRPLSAALDDEIVFLYRATRGACTESFGSHCAAAADVPADVITRARHVSLCRTEGRQLKRVDVATDEADRKEEALAALFGSFLEFDFGVSTADDFFDTVEHLMEWCVLGN